MFLHAVAGVKPGKLVEAHGSFSTASCIKCKTKQDSAEVKVQITSDCCTTYALFFCINYKQLAGHHIQWKDSQMHAQVLSGKYHH